MSAHLEMIKDPIDELLKADAAAQPYVDDAGFALRVMDALPPPSRQWKTLRFILPFSFTVISALVVALFAGGGNFLVDAMMDIATSTFTKATFAVAAMLVLAIGITFIAANDS